MSLLLRFPFNIGAPCRKVGVMEDENKSDFIPALLIRKYGRCQIVGPPRSPLSLIDAGQFIKNNYVLASKVPLLQCESIFCVPSLASYFILRSAASLWTFSSVLHSTMDYRPTSSLCFIVVKTTVIKFFGSH